MFNKKKLRSLLFLFQYLCFTGLMWAFIINPGKGYTQTPAQRYREFNLVNETTGIHGYDPVSYFTGKPLKGVESIRFTYKEINYLFATEANMKKFRDAPEKYEPQYGGWCAFAMGEKGEKVDVNPLTFKISGGKLYLFYNKYLNNTLNAWNKNEILLKQSADTNWNKIINQP